jgi:ATP-dependent Clp endopeptidase proteolytic subunit ClpP
MFSVNTDSREILIYDEIGPALWGLVSAEAVTDALVQLQAGPVTVRLNTPGGSVDEGIAIFNALKRHAGEVTTVADSLAASMGSYLLQAGNVRRVTGNAMVMVHDPWSIAIGNAEMLRTEAGILDKYRDRMVPDYAAASGKSAEEVASIMAEETWYTGQEAIEAGFADELEVYDEGEEEPEPQIASLHRIARKLPPALAAKMIRKPQQAQSQPATPRRDRAARLIQKNGSICH